ncbi:hypothetical protein GCM10009776_19600 [Microbacterium deminutum]|uniref:DUF222 domain-containing protein n=2 Tax=Microbacterium deminutum TaxID=344164 RepID=A0ABN2QST0_9MICO
MAALQAREAALLAEATDLAMARAEERRAMGRRGQHDLALREVTSELGAAMRLSDRTVQERMSSASTLTESFAATYLTFQKGGIDAAHVSGIIDAGGSIGDAELRAQFERIVLEAARFETPPRLRAIARVVAARIDPDLVEELQRNGFAGRCVRVTDLGDGMARLLADLPATLAHAILDRLTQLGHEILHGDPETDAEAWPLVDETDADHIPDGSATVVTGPRIDASGAAADADAGEPTAIASPLPDLRTLDEVRADVLADLLLCGAPTAHGDGDALASIRAHVQVTLPVLTAAGVDKEPSLLAGVGPIDRETARLLAANAPGWDRVMYDPYSGAPLAVDRYRPSKQLRRFLRVRDERCRFPGCTQRPWRCDLDHTVDAAFGGATTDCNLAHFCRRHHTVKHATAWRVRQLGQGRLEWTSLTGRRYVDRPPAIVQFVPSRAFDAPPGPMAEHVPPF